MCKSFDAVETGKILSNRGSSSLCPACCNACALWYLDTGYSGLQHVRFSCVQIVLIKIQKLGILWTYILTHWDRVMHICVSKLGIHWFRQLQLEPMLAFCSLDPWEKIAMKLSSKLFFKCPFHWRKWILKCSLRNGGNFASASMCLTTLLPIALIFYSWSFHYSHLLKCLSFCTIMNVCTYVCTC